MTSACLAVLTDQGAGYLLSADLPTLEGGIYELWGADSNGTLTGLGSMEQSGIAKFDASGDIAKLLITVEPSFVPQPTSAPIMQGTVVWKKTVQVAPQPPAADARFVTLSATYGAGGSVIGPLLAPRVGLPFADRLIQRGDVPAHPSGEGVERKRNASRNRVRRLCVVCGTSMWRSTSPRREIPGLARPRS